MLKQFEREREIYLSPELVFLTANFFGELGLTSGRNYTSVTNRDIETTGLARLGDLLVFLAADVDGPGPVWIGVGVANLGGVRTTFEPDDLGLVCRDTHNFSSSVTVQV